MAAPVSQDLRFYFRLRRVQQIGRYLMLAAAFAAIAGLFGGGPLSWSVAGDPGTASVEYERYVRHHAPFNVVLHLKRVSADTVTVSVPATLLEKIKVSRITPEPVRQQAGDGRLTYTFDVEGAPMSVRFELQADGYGSLPFEMKLGSGQALHFSTFVYP